MYYTILTSTQKDFNIDYIVTVPTISYITKVIKLKPIYEDEQQAKINLSHLTIV